MNRRITGRFPIYLLLLIVLGCANREALPSREGIPKKARNDDTLHVLFIGNSHTYTHNVPRMVGRLNDSQVNSPALAIRSVAEPAYTLEDHIKNGKAKQTIETGYWNFVVIQPASMERFSDPEAQIRNFRVFADAAPFKGIPILYGIWHREAGHEFYGRENMPTTPALAAEKIRETNLASIDGTGARLAAAGDAWVLAQSRYPDLKLYTDGNHTTVAGAYLAAAVVLRSILQQPINGNPPWVPEGLSDQDAGRLLEVANAIPMVTATNGPRKLPVQLGQ